MRPSTRTWLAIVAALFVIAVATWIIILISSVPSQNPDRSDVAGEWQGYLAPVAIAVTLLGGIAAFWARGRQPGLDQDPVRTDEMLARAADQLARQSGRFWLRAAHQWGLTNVTPIAVRWRWNRGLSLPVGELFGPGEAPDSGSVLTLPEALWSRLTHHRLVVLGEPGAGKTGALILLLLHVVKGRAAITAAEDRARVPVPLLIGLRSWHPNDQSLVQFVADTMIRDYPALRGFGRDVAQRLVEDGRIQLLLDGLDEIPPEVRAGALACIDKETPGMRVILASRPKAYRDASGLSGLAHAAVIDLSPVDSAAVAEYLTQGHNSPAVRERWRRFSADLAARPTSAAAKALRTPLTLTLARATYSGRHPDGPEALTTFGESRDVTTAVIGAFFTVAYPDPKERDRALRWLGWIARNVGSGGDIRWWDVPRWVPAARFRVAARWLLCGTGAIIGALALLVAGEHRLQIKLDDHLLSGVTTAVLLGAAMGIVLGWLSSGPLIAKRTTAKNGPANPAIRCPHPGEFVSMLGAGLGTAALGGVISWYVGLAARDFFAGHPVAVLSPAWGAAGGFVIGFVGLLASRWAKPSEELEAVTPLGAYRSDLIASVIVPVITGVVLGSIAGVSALSRVSDHLALLRGLSTGLITMVLSWLAGSAVSAVRLTELILLFTTRHRVRFLRLFEDAARRDVLRQTGAVYRFRHAALQEHLASLASARDRRSSGAEDVTSGATTERPS
jgi:hypothetical protein